MYVIEYNDKLNQFNISREDLVIPSRDWRCIGRAFTLEEAEKLLDKIRGYYERY